MSILYHITTLPIPLHTPKIHSSLLILQSDPAMLLRGAILRPLNPSSVVRLKTTSSSLPQNVAVSARPPSRKSYSISDGDLESQGFILRRTPADLNLDDLNKVFVAVGFPKRDPDKIRVALDNTDALLWIEYEKTRRPVAFARATGDGVFNAIIWDVVVDPSFQGIGLGKAVMERLLEELLEKGITNIALYSEPRVLGFYRPMGFVADPDGIRGMVYSRKQRKKK
ncbi:FkbH domain containing protein [Parasponia andersonii]|uniref:FkbH domain containing protein n=1 Tax=Parasponia andersonii TaxID=3476 RepID=A0A2P5DMV8_PARAD|nr:FkbH domain containing protein [Parasponia andersonii]